MTDSFQCPACEVWSIVSEGAEEKMHEHQFFCKDCMAYLIGYINYQRLMRKEYDDQKKDGIFHLE